MAKAMRVTVSVYEPVANEPREYAWTVWFDKRAPAGWTFRDHEGYERFSAGNWNELVARVHQTADNYGCRARIS